MADAVPPAEMVPCGDCVGGGVGEGLMVPVVDGLAVDVREGEDDIVVEGVGVTVVVCDGLLVGVGDGVGETTPFGSQGPWKAVSAKAISMMLSKSSYWF